MENAQKKPETGLEATLDWCAGILGPFRMMSDRSKVHGAHDSATLRLQTSSGFCYLKIHQNPAAWHQEVYAYEQWARAFGDLSPALIAARDEAPLALIVTERPGQVLEEARLAPAQERAVWRSAGAALVALHDLAPGERFGPCRRDGTFAEGATQDAVAYISGKLSGAIEQARQARLIDAGELATLQAACELIPAFKGERPTACHRDYCAANLLVDTHGALTGVIDFEFACWDVRVADFSRDPDWAWYRRPDLLDAFLEGYGRPLTCLEEQQLLVAHAEYAISAINWGHAYAFYGFEQEGRDALVHLAPLVR